MKNKYITLDTAVNDLIEWHTEKISCCEQSKMSYKLQLNRIKEGYGKELTSYWEKEIEECDNLIKHHAEAIEDAKSYLQ